MEEENNLKPKKKLKYDNPLFQAIHSDVHHKKRNSMIVVCGKVGTGKSVLALKIAESLDPTFTPETLQDRLILSPTQLMTVISKEKNKLKRGQAIIIDEASTQMYNRQWASVNNQMINFIVTTFRHRGLICIMTVPYLDFLDSNVRRLFDYFVETTKIDFAVKQTSAKVYKLSYNKMKADKPYKEFFRKRDSDGIVKALDPFWFDKCSDLLEDKYEEVITPFKNQIVADALSKSISLVEKEEKKNIDINAIVAKMLENKKRYFGVRAGKPCADKIMIENDFQVGSTYSIRIKKMAEAEILERDILNI